MHVPMPCLLHLSVHRQQPTLSTQPLGTCCIHSSLQSHARAPSGAPCCFQLHALHQYCQLKVLQQAVQAAHCCSRQAVPQAVQHWGPASPCGNILVGKAHHAHCCCADVGLEAAAQVAVGKGMLQKLAL